MSLKFSNINLEISLFHLFETFHLFTKIEEKKRLGFQFDMHKKINGSNC